MTENVRESLLEADERRYRALYDVDTAGLATILHPSYLHTHANGRTENRDEFIRSIDARRYQFLLAERSGQTVRAFENFAILSGVTHTTISIAGVGRSMSNAFTTVWVRHGKSTPWCLLNWQATALGEA